MFKRKPVPRAQTPTEENIDARPSVPTLPPVDPTVQRYSLSDPPMLPPIQEHEDDISQAVNRMLGRNGSTHSSEQQQLLEQPPVLTEPPQLHYNDRDSRPMTYKPYQPGQYLAPIMTGETLQIDNSSATATPVYNGIHDLPPANTAYAQQTQPELRNSMYSQTISDPRASLYSDPFHDPNTPIGSTSNLSSEHTYYEPTYEPTATAYAGAPIDHFAHDTEAYTTGQGLSPAHRRIPRSRSPTPAVDEEDYFIVGNDSMHHTGYDAEKAALREMYGPNGSGYGRPGGYYPQEHHIVFDPEPETPKSTAFSLPESQHTQQETTLHFGPAPTGRVVRRHKTKKRVQLTNGNLVVDLKVPPRLVLPRKGEPETTHTRYTAVTCDPDEFEKKGFFLRQNETGRRTELFIVITMYNVSHLFFSIDVAKDGAGRRNPLLPNAIRSDAQHLPSLHSEELPNLGT